MCPSASIYAVMSESRDLNKFLVRMPEGMRDRIAEAAKVANRSMNAEIVARLEKSFSAGGVDERLTGLEESLKELHKMMAGRGIPIPADDD